MYSRPLFYLISFNSLGPGVPRLFFPTPLWLCVTTVSEWFSKRILSGADVCLLQTRTLRKQAQPMLLSPSVGFLQGWRGPKPRWNHPVEGHSIPSVYVWAQHSLRWVTRPSLLQKDARPVVPCLALDAGVSQGDRACGTECPSSYRHVFLFVDWFALFLISIPPTSCVFCSPRPAYPHCSGSFFLKRQILSVWLRFYR